MKAMWLLLLGLTLMNLVGCGVSQYYFEKESGTNTNGKIQKDR